MLPNLTDKVSCLEALVGIRSKPCGTTVPPFYVEQIDGIDLNYLAQVANVSNPSGEQFANTLIKNAAAEMMGDLELLLNNGFSLNETIGEVCSTCEFGSLYVAGGGIKVTNGSGSAFSTIRITNIKIKANVTDAHSLKIDDGILAKTYPINLVSGVVMPIILDYQTQAKTVYISLVDQSVGLAQINCPTTSSCGCGGGNPATNLVQYTGMTGSTPSSIQYGFIICANVGCSNDTLVCDLIRQTPNLFGLTLLYKVGEKINSNSKLSLRNNRVGGQDKTEKEEEMFKYNGLYRKRMYGAGNEKGLTTVINNYLRQRNGDRCVKCDERIKTGYAIG